MKILLQQLKLKSGAIALLKASFICLALSGCNENPFVQGDSSNQNGEVFDYKRDDSADEFSSLSKSSASASFEKNKLMVHVTVICISNAKDAEKNEVDLEVYAVRKENDQEIGDISAILYKIDDRDPQIYRDDVGNGVSFDGRVNANLDHFYGIIGSKAPEIMKIRLVRGATPLAVGIGNIDDLAALPKIDLEIPIRTSNVEKVIADCHPR
ncbi:hypothetical protein [Sphingopyxis sp. 22461]|uniref:hypothetical protein n=1 Tax=Sphingopyxis sp. 22461 TaxID=3453923 RepID=UPI003F82A284